VDSIVPGSLAYQQSLKISVVIPSFRVTAHVLTVVEGIGPEVSRIYVVDDCCPDGSGNFVEQNCTDERLVVLRNKRNLGVGGAVLAGYTAAISDGADVIVKIDGDGQMDPSLLPRFIAPILKGEADYTKGNRFYDLVQIGNMPPMRLFGNAVLSFMTKLSSGYWSIFDPTNGYTAIHAKIAAYLPMDKIDNRYFFETDMLFRLNTLRAVVVDIPMNAVYGDEKSNLHISKILVEFLGKHVRNFAKRIFYNYFLRDMTLASIELLVGTALLNFGLIFGAVSWFNAEASGTPAPLGVIMLATLPILLGIQFILAFLGFDIATVPKRPIHNDLPDILGKHEDTKHEK
jgi:glycosyltransferase involved in cell wall biosynthesis